MLTGSVPVMQCVLLSTGFQVSGLYFLLCPVLLFISFTIHLISSETCSVIFISSYDVDVCVGDPRRPYPTDLEMRSGILGNMSNMSTNGVNGHLPGDALAAGRLPGRFTLLFHLSALFSLPGLSLSYKYCGLCVAMYFSVEVQNVSLMFIFC